MTSPPAPRSDKLCHPCVRPTTRRSSQPGCLQLVGDVLVREEDHRLAAPNLEKRGGAADASVSVSPLAGGETEESEGGQSRRGESRGLPLTLQLLGTTPCMSIIAPSSRSSALRTVGPFQMTRAPCAPKDPRKHRIAVRSKREAGRRLCTAGRPARRGSRSAGPAPASATCVLDPPFGLSLGGWNACRNFKTTSC